MLMLVDSLRSFKSKLQTKLNSSDKRAKIQDSDFVIGLLQAVAQAKGNFSLSEIRLSVCQFLGLSIGASAFNERIGTTSLAKHLKLALEILINSTISNDSNLVASEIAVKLGVNKIIGVDSSMVTLWDGLSDVFKGTFMESAAKLHMAINLVTGSISWFDLTPGSTHDSKRFPDIQQDCLYIFDLGYWSTILMQKISNQQSYFLTRVKGNAKLTISKVVYGIGKSAIGKDLLSIPINRKRGSIVEVFATTFIGKNEIEFRVLGFWNKKSKSYHWYLTNIDAPRDIVANLYRLRWQVELSFKAMKSTLNFDRMPTLNKNAVESFALIALINYMFSVIIRSEAETLNLMNGKDYSKTTSILKSAKAFSEGAQAILEGLKIGRRITNSWIANLQLKLKILLEFVFDPNRKKRNSTIACLLGY